MSKYYYQYRSALTGRYISKSQFDALPKKKTVRHRVERRPDKLRA